MGRIRWSGSPVALARMKTTTVRMARATSDWTRRARTKRTTGSRDGPLLARRQVVQEEVVHHRPGVPLAERLGGRVRRVEIDHRDPVVLAAQPREDVAHE